MLGEAAVLVIRVAEAREEAILRLLGFWHESQTENKRFPRNLSDCVWRCRKPLLPLSRVGRPRQFSLNQVLNTILYVLKTGC
jgi:hypothetical protein